MSAEKQKRYRERKKKADYLSNDFGVTKLRNEAIKAGMEQEYMSLVEEFYDIGGQILADRLCFELYSFVSLVNSVNLQFSDKLGAAGVLAGADRVVN